MDLGIQRVDAEVGDRFQSFADGTQWEVVAISGNQFEIKSLDEVRLHKTVDGLRLAIEYKQQ